MNDPTVTAPDLNSTAEDTPLTVTAANGVLSNDTDNDDSLSVLSFTVDTGTGTQTAFVAGQTADITGVGTITLNADGGYSFTPATNYNGPVPVVTYTTNTGAQDSLTLSVTPVNDPPVAENDNFSVNEGESVSGNIITHNDGDGSVDYDGGDGLTLGVTHVDGNELIFDANGDATIPVEGGMLTIKADGQFTYLNSEGYVLGAIPPSFEYTLSDGSNSDTANVFISIIDTAPLAVDDNNYIQYKDNAGFSVSSLVRGIVLENFNSGGSTGDRADSSADGTVIITQVEYDGLAYVFDANNTSFTIDTGFGRLIMNDQGKYFFVLESGIDITTIPSSLEFTYTIKDGDVANPETDDAVLTIHLTHFESGLRSAVSDEGQLIDLSLSESEQVTDFVVNEASNSSISNADLSDLFIQENTNTLENYLSLNNFVDSEGTNITDETLVTENVEIPDLLENEEVIVSNGFLEQGATILSDTTPEHLLKHTELDTTDLL